MAPEAHDTSCPMAGCGGPTYWRRDGYRVCMHCGHELAAHDALPSAPEGGRRSASRAVSSSGLIAAGLVAGAMVFSLASSAHPALARPAVVREASFAERDLVAILESSRQDPGALERLSALLRFQDVEALTNAEPAALRSANSIANDWVNFHAETKRQIALVLNDLASDPNLAPYRSVQLPVLLLLGEILLAGVELEPRALERLVENFRIYAAPYGAGLLQAVGRHVQGYAPPEPRLQQQIHDLLIDPF